MKLEREGVREILAEDSPREEVRGSLTMALSSLHSMQAP